MRTQRERVEESARRLAEAAIDLIAERGYSQTTAKDIGLRAGYSRAMVAERFGGREALLDFVLEHYYEQRLSDDIDPAARGMDSLLSPVVALSAFALEDPRTLRAMFILNFEAVHNADGLRERVRAWLKRLRENLAEATRIGQADGSVRTDVNPVDVAADIVAAGIGYAYAWIVMVDDGDLASTLARWHASLEDSLRAR